MYIPDNESDFYTAISDNLLLNINEINLKSWVDTSYNVSFNTNNFNYVFSNYLNRGKKDIWFTAKIPNEILFLKANQVKGNYVLILNLPFFEKSVDGGNDNPIWRSYVMDVTTMQGNVYDFRVFAKQDLYYNIEDNLIYDTVI